MKIPKSFKVFASTINVLWNNTRMNDLNCFGLYESYKYTITLSDIDNMEKIAEDKIIDTFYHEKVHAILIAMNEKELNNNEIFVDVFAKLLRQTDETAVY